MTAILTRSRSYSSLVAGALAFTLILTLGVPLAAAEDPSAFIANLGTQGIQALGPQVSSTERLTRLRQLLQQDFDIRSIGSFALGRYRLAMTPQEQQEFFRLYPDFTIRVFSNRLNEYGGATFRVIGRRSAGNETIVSSEIVRAGGGRIPLDWYLTDGGGRYRVTDVTVGGVSTRVALRDRFASWIENNGGRFSALLAVLRQQLAQAQ